MDSCDSPFSKTPMVSLLIQEADNEPTDHDNFVSSQTHLTSSTNF